jgi:hypothetical protein
MWSFDKSSIRITALCVSLSLPAHWLYTGFSITAEEKLNSSDSPQSPLNFTLVPTIFDHLHEKSHSMSHPSSCCCEWSHLYLKWLDEWQVDAFWLYQAHMSEFRADYTLLAYGRSSDESTMNVEALCLVHADKGVSNRMSTVLSLSYQSIRSSDQYFNSNMDGSHQWCMKMRWILHLLLMNNACSFSLRMGWTC